MGRLIVVILVAAIGWMGWWFAGSRALDSTLTTWVDDRRAEGWAADVAEIDVAGFPNRFDTTLTDVRFADPETGVAWSAPFLQLLSLAYKPSQIIAVLPDEHRLSTPLQTIAITHDQARGSIFLSPKPSLPLDRSVIILDRVRLASDLGWDVDLAQGRFATEPVAARTNAHRVGAEFSGLRLPNDLRNAFDPAGLLPEDIERMRLDADLGFTAPWDRTAIEVARPQVTDIDLKDLSANWGSVTFRAAGALQVDPNGTPEGTLSVKAVDWQKLLDLAVASGLLPEDQRTSTENALNLIASLKGPADTIDVDLTFRRGTVFIGPIPIGEAPRIIIR